VTSIVVFVAQLFRHFEAGFGMILQEAEKVFSLNEIHLAGINGFGGKFIGLAGDGGAQAQNFSGFGDFQDQSLAIGGADGQLHAAFAQNKNSARGLALDKQNRAFGVGGGVLDGFEGLQRSGGQIAKDTIGPHLAGKTAFDDVQSVW
jgi:hypothetical protein